MSGMPLWHYSNCPRHAKKPVLRTAIPVSAGPAGEANVRFRASLPTGSGNKPSVRDIS